MRQHTARAVSAPSLEPATSRLSLASAAANLVCAPRCGQPLLPQRRYWARDEDYSKPVLLRRAVHFSLGFHQLRPSSTRNEKVIGAVHPHLRLLHLHYADQDR